MRSMHRSPVRFHAERQAGRVYQLLGIGDGLLVKRRKPRSAWPPPVLAISGVRHQSLREDRREVRSPQRNSTRQVLRGTPDP